MIPPSTAANELPRRRWLPPLRRPAAWVVLLAAIPFLALAYLALPIDGLARTIAYPVYGLVGMTAILIGTWVRRPARVVAWRLLALALALLALGDITYSILELSGDVPYPSLADISYLAGYACLIAGFWGLVRGSIPGGDRTSVIDAAILAAGAGSLFWIGIIQPSVEGAVDPIAGIVSIFYPAMDLILLALGLRVILRAGPSPRSLQLLIAGISVYFVADVIYAVMVIDGSYVDGNPVDIGWIIGILLLGVAALHPSITQSVTIAERTEPHLGRIRLAALAGAALVAPTLLLFKELDKEDFIVPGLVLEWAILFGLVLVRLASTVDQLAISLRERRRLQTDLAHQATHDPLTQLANRLLFEARLAKAMTSAPQTTALIFLDLDDFKAINDTLGHPTGDELLRIIATRIQRGLRATDLAARLGGDEFAILVEDCDDVVSVQAVADRALMTLRTPVNVGGHQFLVHASAGVAMGRKGATAVDLMRDADIAMYKAKSHGKDQVETFAPEMHSKVTESYELRTELAEAIETEGFVLYYQPVLNLDSGHIVGAEALVRWNHPVRGLVAPLEFIPEAESSGLIHDLGRWILRDACATAAGWPNRLDGERPAVSVNLAASQLHQPGLVDDVAKILSDTGLPPRKLILEVTESALVDVVVARAALLRLSGLGVLLALDDFGTGYSALSYIADLPFDIIKIDRSFIAGIGKGPRTDALLEAIFGLSDALELDVVAEGIEVASQLDRLRGLGCRMGQGFLFAHPAPNSEFVHTLTTTDLGARWHGSDSPHANPPASSESPRDSHRRVRSGSRPRRHAVGGLLPATTGRPK